MGRLYYRRSFCFGQIVAPRPASVNPFNWPVSLSGDSNYTKSPWEHNSGANICARSASVPIQGISAADVAPCSARLLTPVRATTKVCSQDTLIKAHFNSTRSKQNLKHYGICALFCLQPIPLKSPFHSKVYALK